MACASSVDEKMAELEESLILDAPANILRYGVVEKLSMQLSINGALVNWKNVADELGFTNLEISGHYANFAGSEPALRMMNDWIFKKNGNIRELVRVFLSLELYGCIEDLKEDLEKYHQQLKRISEEDGERRNEGVLGSTTSSSSSHIPSVTRGASSGPVSYPTANSSICSSGPTSLPSTYDDSSLRSNTSSAQTSLQSNFTLDSLPCPYASVKSSMTSSPTNTKSNSENSPKNTNRPLSQPNRCQNDSIITATEWPETDSKVYKRSISVPHENIYKTKSKPKKSLFFKRSQSLEQDKEIHKKKFPSFLRFKKEKKKNKAAKNEKTNSTGKASNEEPTKEKVDKNTTVKGETDATSVTIEGSYSEAPSTLKPNLSPLIVSEVKCKRPVSSGSEDSLPFSPSSPASPMGYESGYHSGDNSFKRIYIVCCPEEEEVYQRALKLYYSFYEKGYECHLFATDTREVMEVGRFRYEMQQVKDADFVFLCVSKKLKETFEVPVCKAQTFKDEDTKGLRHVSDFMMTFFANDCCNKNGKFMTILLMEDSYDHIPFVMNSYLRYKWPEQERRMENTIHQRSEIMSPVSDTKLQAPIKVCTPKGVVNASVRLEAKIKG